MSHRPPSTQEIHVLTRADDDAVDRALEEVVRAVWFHQNAGEPWIDELEVYGEPEALEPVAEAWLRRADVDALAARLRARGDEVAARLEGARAAITFEAHEEGLSGLQESAVAYFRQVLPGVVVVTDAGALVAPRPEIPRHAIPASRERRRAPSFDGGVDAALFEALIARALLEVEGFDAAAAAREWADAGRPDTGEGLMEWLLERDDVVEVYASEDDLERAMAVRW